MDWKNRLKKILFPHVALVFILFNVTVAGLITIFVKGWELHFLSYFFYVLSCYTLTIVCVRIPGIVKKVNQLLHKNKYTDAYLTNADLRIQISMYRGLVIGIVFATFKIILGFVYDSSWFFAMAG